MFATTRAAESLTELARPRRERLRVNQGRSVRRFRLPSTATVLSVIALFVALGGTAGAASGLIGSPQIKNGSIQLVDISATAKKALKGARGPAGARGAQGAQGPQGTAGLSGAVGAQGAQGPQGPAGAAGANGTFDPAKVTVRQGPATTVPANDLATLVATCNAGETAISGGWFADTGIAYLEAIDAAKTKYTVGIDNLGAGTIAGSGSAIVVCAAK